MSSASPSERRRSFFGRRSLAGRIIVLTTLAVGLSVTALAFAAYFTVQSQSLSTLDSSLRTRALATAASTEIDALETDRVPAWALGLAGVKIIYLDTAKIPQSRSADHVESLSIGKPELNVAAGKTTFSARTIGSDKLSYRVVAVPAGPGRALVLAQALTPTETMLDHLRLVLIAFGLLGVGVAGAAGYVVARDGLSPVRRLTASVDAIGRTGEPRTIEVEGHDEVALLAGAFNTMLGALTASQERQRDLVADASHELRTPLTSMRTNLDLLAQSDGQLPDELRREILDDVRAQITEMTSLIGDLVELARDNHPTTTYEPLDFADVVEAALARARRRATTQEFQVRLESWPITGDPGALERAVTNLLDNAIKWSPDFGTIEVDLHHGTLVVIDGGPGIAAEDMPRVFDRFYRAPASRSMPGSGLGLAIVADVARRHGGSVRVGRAAQGGAALSFALPRDQGFLPEDQATETESS